MKVRPLIVPLLVLPWFSSCQDHFARVSQPVSIPATKEQAAPDLVHWKKYFPDPQLVALIDKALEGNSDLKVAMARIGSARARLRASRSALAPTVGLEAGAVKSRSGRRIADDYSNSGTDYTLGLQASWELDLWGRLRSERGAAYDRLLASFEARRLVQSNLIADVAGAYYELKALDANLQIIERTRQTQEEALESVMAQHAAGQVTSLGVEQFQAQLKNIQARSFEIQGEIAANEGALNLLLGHGPAPIARSKASILDERVPRLASGSTSLHLTNRPDIRQAELELSASRADVKAAKAAFYPTVTIDGMLGLQAFKPNLLLNSGSLAHQVQGGLVAPLINRGAIKAQFAEANAAQLEALFTYQQSVVNGYVEVHNQIAASRLLEKQGKLKAEECELLEKSEATSTELFRAGRASYLEMLTARQSSLQAGLDRIDIRKQQLLAAVNLYRALGGG